MRGSLSVSLCCGLRAARCCGAAMLLHTALGQHRSPAPRWAGAALECIEQTHTALQEIYLGGGVPSCAAAQVFVETWGEDDGTGSINSFTALPMSCTELPAHLETGERLQITALLRDERRNPLGSVPG
ncbi:hypothetical protein AAFF_G00153650 [Aldrovandia affinis]|uniref:Uncharacterized protein n=1 Tax=Aldrovandia affinis TaxID=143900 RepID=A0AAD7T0V1_9TELE|nr:hypothetical protein AAFF_G00153650 [Aldrovandia affinis]